MASALAMVEDWEVDTLAVGVTDATHTLDTHGPVDEVLQTASVTKPLTAYAVLVAVRDGAVHLDEPAGPTAEQGGTVRHLLAHAAGLPFEDDAPAQTPERRRVYSNWGYQVLADLVAERVGTDFADHLDLEVLEPLGMRATRLEGPPGSGAVSTVTDLLAFARELLAPRLLDDDEVAAAREVAFPGLEGVLPGFGRQRPNDWGLGFEIKDAKSPHWTGDRLAPSTFGHFGQSGSFLWVDPEAGIASALLSDRDFGRWAASGWPRLTDAVHEEHA